MAQYINNTTGLSSVAANFDKQINTPAWHASTVVTVGTTEVYGTKFTAPNTTNSFVGVVIYISGHGTASSAGTLTITLYDHADTVRASTGKTLVINCADIYNNTVGTSGMYFRFSVPHTFTSTTTGYYQLGFVRSSPATGTISFGANATTASLVEGAIFDDEAAVPGSGDKVAYSGQNADGTVRTLTLDGTQTWGARTSTAVPTGLFRASWGVEDVYGLDKGKLKWDTAASATLICRGDFVVGIGSEYEMGNSTSAYPTGKVANLTFSPATSGDHGIYVSPGAKETIYGEVKGTSGAWKAHYVSGTGTTGSPLVTDVTTGWSVGDKVLIGASSNNVTNYNECENKYIRTKVNDTTYTLSDTLGGAETAGLTYTHNTNAWVWNLTRNVVFNTDDVAKGFYHINVSGTPGDVNAYWFRIEQAGSSASTKTAWYFDNPSGSSTIYGLYGYCVADNPIATGWYWNVTKNARTMTDIIACNNAQTTSTIIVSGIANHTLTNVFAVNCKRSGIVIQGGTANCTMNNFYVIACNKDSTTTAGGIVLSSGNLNTFNYLEAHCNGDQGIYASSATTDNIINFAQLGTKGTNELNDIWTSNNAYNTILFYSPYVASAALITNYLNQVPGSQIKIHALNGTAYKHRTYSPGGSLRACGAGLTDTTVRTVGNYSEGYYAEDASVGIVKDYKVSAKSNTYVSASLFLWGNAAFVAASDASIQVDLYLPGSTTPDATKTMTKTTDAFSANAACQLAAYYTGAEDSYATVRVTVKTVTANAYAYVADFFNGTNSITGFKTWYQGQPSPIMFEQLGDANAVWAVLTSTQTVSGTMGWFITKLLTVAKFLGLK